MSDHDNRNLTAWLPPLPKQPDGYLVQSASRHGRPMLTTAFDRADAERIVADLHARGYRARVIRERTTREIVDTTT